MQSKNYLNLLKFSNFKDFDAYRRSEKSSFHRTLREDKNFIEDKHDYYLKFFCIVCNSETKMQISKQLSFFYEGAQTPLWRETITCIGCGLNNRMRAILNVMFSEIRFTKNAEIYFTEQITNTFKAAAREWPRSIGSEFLRDGTPKGKKNNAGIRSEDMTKLTFRSASFDGFVTMDVIEHVSDYKKAFSEIYRVLKPGGNLVLSAPFNLDFEDSLIRAKVDKDGHVIHFVEPEYHGDPLDPNGLLCFTTFGWDFLKDLSEVGFENPTMNFYWSDRLGYLGIQYCVLAQKPRRQAPGPMLQAFRRGLRLRP